MILLEAKHMANYIGDPGIIIPSLIRGMYLKWGLFV